MKHAGRVSAVDTIAFMRSSDAGPFRGIQIALGNKASPEDFTSGQHHMKRHELRVENLASKKITKISVKQKVFEFEKKKFIGLELHGHQRKNPSSIKNDQTESKNNNINELVDNHDETIIFTTKSKNEEDGWFHYEFGLDEYLVGFHGVIVKE